MSIGVGRRVDDPVALPRSYLEASRAVDVGRWAKGRHVTEVFDELGLERLLASTPTDDLAEFVQHAIGPLVEYDRSNDTDLVETLGVWLETHNMAEAEEVCDRVGFLVGGKIPVTGSPADLKRDFGQDRIDVTTKDGPVLTNAARSLECEVAIYVARHYDGPWALAPNEL